MVVRECCKSPEKIVVEALGFIEAFEAVHGLKSCSASPRPQLWVAPLAAWVKVNCDASLLEEVQGIGLECCVRNSEGFCFLPRQAIGIVHLR